MHPLPSKDGALRTLRTRTGQRVATSNAALRRALARLVASGGNPRGGERRTR